MGIVPEKQKMSLENAEVILQFLTIFEDSKFEAGRLVMKPGTFPYWKYDNQVLAFVKALYENRWIIDFDWPSWQQEAKKYLADHELLKEADLTALRKLLTTHVRKDRFCDGHLASAIQQGQISAILLRIKVLKEDGIFEMEDS